MKFAVEMGPGAMMYIPNFIKIDFRRSNVVGWGGLTDTRTA
jgi:hypothetical protein